MSTYSLLDSFDCDDGSLNGLPPQTIFAMGVEWVAFRKLLLAGPEFRMLCMTHNRDRLVKLAETHNRFVEDRPITNTTQWTEIWVGDLIKK